MFTDNQLTEIHELCMLFNLTQHIQTPDSIGCTIEEINIINTIGKQLPKGIKCNINIEDKLIVFYIY